MSTVSCSSQTFSDSSEYEYECDEEGPYLDGADFAGYEYLSSNSSQGSLDIDNENEAVIPEDDECAVDQNYVSFKFTAASEAENQVQEMIHGQPRQHVNLVSEDPTISETPWTDEKHNLYLNSIEEAFVQRLYERGGHHRYSCKGWESQSITSYVPGKRSYEDFESGISCDCPPFNLFPGEADERCNDEEIQSRTKRFRLQEDDINERVNNCKSLKEKAGEGSAEMGEVQSGYTPKIQTQCFKDTHGTNKEFSEH